MSTLLIWKMKIDHSRIRKTEMFLVLNGAEDLNLLPHPFNSKYDQIMAGTLMLGIHKLGIALSSHIGNVDQK